MIPVDAQITREGDVTYQAVDVNRFNELKSVGVAMNPSAAEITVKADGTATAVCVYSMTFTPISGRVENTRAQRAQFRLRRKESDWFIEQVDYQ